MTADQAAESLAEAASVGVTHTSAVGHVDMACIMSTDLKMAVAHNRATVSLDAGKHCLLVAQYRGPRLPEGATSLPEGASIQWVGVRLKVVAD